MRRLKHLFFPTTENKRLPHMLRYESLAAILLLAIVLELGAVYGTFRFGSGLFASVLPATLTDLTNTERSRNNEPTLTVNPILTEAAQMKANDMAAHQYFAHTSPAGIDPWFWFTKAGYTFSTAGENLAMDFTDSDQVVNAWMNSPEHRENILKQSYTEIGIATAEGEYEGHHTIYVVQLFATPATTPATSTLTIATTSESVPIAVARVLAQASSSGSVLAVHTTQRVIHTAHTPSVASTTRPIAPVIVIDTSSSTSTQPSMATAQVATRTSMVVGTAGSVDIHRETFVASVVRSIAASPLTFVNNLLIIILIMFVALYVIALAPIHTEWIHRYAVANGASAIAVLVMCLMVNTLYGYTFRINTVQSSDQQATVINALQ